MNTITVSLLLVALFFGMILCLAAGRRLGRKKIKQDPEGARAGVGTVEGVVFALLGLMIAFTFSGAAGRFDTRRNLVLEEANDIGKYGFREPAELAPHHNLRDRDRRHDLHDLRPGTPALRPHPGERDRPPPRGCAGGHEITRSGVLEDNALDAEDELGGFHVPISISIRGRAVDLHLPCGFAGLEFVLWIWR